MPIRTFIEAVREACRGDAPRRVRRRPGEDVGKKGGVFLATDGLWPSSATTGSLSPLTER